MQNKSDGQRSLYRRFWWAEDTSWRWAVLAGFVMLGGGLLMAGMMWALPLALEVPRRADLVAVVGVVQSSVSKGNEIIIHLEGQPLPFSYGPKAGELGVVDRAVTPGVTVELLVPAGELTTTWGPISVYAVTVDGRGVRTFEDVERSWRRDNDAIRNVLGPIFLAIGAILAALFFLTARHELRCELGRGAGTSS